MVKNLTAMQKTWVRSLGWEDPLEEGMAAYSSDLAWRIPMDRGARQVIVRGVIQSMTERLSTAQHSRPRTHALQKEKPRNKKPTHLNQTVGPAHLEKACCSNKDPALPKANK